MKTLSEMIKIMQAADDGADIECKIDKFSVWIPRNEPVWNWANRDYRVAKPKPREIWVNYYELNSDCAHSTKADADKSAIHNRIECVHFREVLE